MTRRRELVPSYRRKRRDDQTSSVISRRNEYLKKNIEEVNRPIDADHGKSVLAKLYKAFRAYQ